MKSGKPSSNKGTILIWHLAQAEKALPKKKLDILIINHNLLGLSPQILLPRLKQNSCIYQCKVDSGKIPLSIRDLWY